MDAALVTGMFNFGFAAKAGCSKDVVQKKDSGFEDVFSKKLEKEKGILEKKENVKCVKNDVNEKKGVEEKKDVTTSEDGGKCEDLNAKTEETKDKHKKEEVKNTKDESDEVTEKINVLVENILMKIENSDVKEISFEDVENFLDVENISLTNDEMLELTEVLNEGLLQSVVEVGPQSVETEKIMFNKYDELEEKLESLYEKLNDSDSNMNGMELKVDENVNDEFNSDELDFDFMSSFEGKDVLKGKEVKDRGSKENSVFSKKENFMENLNQVDVKMDKTGTDFLDVKIENIADTIMDKTLEMQEQIDVIKQISEKVDVNLFEDKSEMIIKLKPDHLGKVTVEIAVENGNITAKFLAESQKVKEILESNMQDLKDHLANQGMLVKDLSVSVGNDSRGQLFEDYNYNTIRKRKKIEEVNNGAYYANDEYGMEELKASYYYPDSTVSFSA